MAVDGAVAHMFMMTWVHVTEQHTDGVDRDASIKVEVLPAIGVVQARSLAAGKHKVCGAGIGLQDVPGGERGVVGDAVCY